MNTRGWIGVDLDGTLAFYASGQGVKHVGEPIPAMAERVKKWLANGQEVRIVTARVSPEWDDVERQTRLIQAWCVEHLGTALRVQCHKDGSMIELWDDRAVCIVKNTGMTPCRIDVSLAAVLDYDLRHGIESDATASLEPEQLHEPGVNGDYLSAAAICVLPVPDHDPVQGFYVNVREARVLAASLLRAADEQEAAAKAPFGLASWTAPE